MGKLHGPSGPAIREDREDFPMLPSASTATIRLGNHAQDQEPARKRFSDFTRNSITCS
jgi:hypothetical protein